MDNRLYDKTYVRLETTYPHRLLFHLGELVDGKVSLMKDMDEFLDIYAEIYRDDYNEMLLLKLAYDKNIINGFFECYKAADWQKRALSGSALGLLVEYVEERYAVILVESLMFVFGFDLKIEVERTWDSPEHERSYFHDKSKIASRYRKRDSKLIKVKEGRKKLQLTDVVKNNVNDSNSGDSIVSDRDEKDVTEKENNNESVSRKESKHSDNSSLKAKNNRPASNSTKSNKQINEKPGKQTDIKDDNIQDVKFYKLMSVQNRRVLKKAFRGNASSQCEMGDYYSEKNTIHLDYNEAVKWYLSSANNGYERAFFELGKLYDKNLPEISDGKKKAIEIYNDMAEKGFPTAQCVLGMKYWFGDGVKVDIKKAVMWLEKAAMQKHENAIKSLADLYLSINDNANARKWYRIGADTGDFYCKEKLRQVGREHSKKA